jgi:hypothetical protein
MPCFPSLFRLKIYSIDAVGLFLDVAVLAAIPGVQRESGVGGNAIRMSGGSNASGREAFKKLNEKIVERLVKVAVRVGRE